MAEIVIVPSAREEASIPLKGSVPPPAMPAAVALTDAAPFVRVSVTVSLASEVDGRTTLKLRLVWFVVLMNALPVPAPFVRVTDTGLSGAIARVELLALSVLSQL